MEFRSVSLLQVETDEPCPSNLEEFLPWAAAKLGVGYQVCFSKKMQGTTIPNSKKRKSEVIMDISQQLSHKSPTAGSLTLSEKDENTVYIVNHYFGEDLVHLQFEKTKTLPRQILTIITLVIEYYPMLRRITVSCGIDRYTAYELGKILALSSITEIFLDGTFVAEANYAILLDEPNCLQVLSLARCRIGDEATKEIASKLHYPLPASKKLCTLILSTNSISDKGVKHLANALRTNRKLSFLNLADNRITDKGGEAILTILVQFPITKEEQLTYKERYMVMLKQKEEEQAETELAFTKLRRTSAAKGKKTIDIKQPVDTARSSLKEGLDQYEDPLDDYTVIDDWRYANGNNALSYLNLSYNKLSYMFIKQLVEVFQYQQISFKKKATGLVNVRIEGNPIPESCPEYEQLDAIIDKGFSVSNVRKGSFTAKKNQTKKTVF